jgi:hypothetical protein
MHIPERPSLRVVGRGELPAAEGWGNGVGDGEVKNLVNKPIRCLNILRVIMKTPKTKVLENNFLQGMAI